MELDTGLAMFERREIFDDMDAEHTVLLRESDNLLLVQQPEQPAQPQQSDDALLRLAEQGGLNTDANLTAVQLEDLRRVREQHPCGVLIANGPGHGKTRSCVAVVAWAEQSVALADTEPSLMCCPTREEGGCGGPSRGFADTLPLGCCRTSRRRWRARAACWRGVAPRS